MGDGDSFARVERAGRRELKRAGADAAVQLGPGQHHLPRVLGAGHVRFPARPGQGHRGVAENAQRVALRIICGGAVQWVGAGHLGAQKEHDSGAPALVPAVEAHVVDAVFEETAAQGRGGVAQQAAARLGGHEPLAVDEAAGRVLAFLRGLGQAGFGAVFVAARREQQQGQE